MSRLQCWVRGLAGCACCYFFFLEYGYVGGSRKQWKETSATKGQESCPMSCI
eukprot:jgi/Botrbrau1/15497/Bobra.43_2s0114.1